MQRRGNQLDWAGTTDFVCLDVVGETISNGSGQLFMNENGTCTGTPTGQNWYLEPSSKYKDGTAVTIHNLLEFTEFGASCLNLAGDNTAAGTAVNLALCNASDAQQWIVHLDAAQNQQD